MDVKKRRLCFFTHTGVSPSIPMQIVLFVAAADENRQAVFNSE